MIIECKNCKKKFTVKDSAIPANGRAVQCGNCSTQWLQMPVLTAVKKNIIKKTSKTNINSPDEIYDAKGVRKNFLDKEFSASDGKKYKFLGNQWAEVLPSGKFGRLAKKKISHELNKLVGREQSKKNKKNITSDQPTNIYQENEGGMGIFSFIIVFIIFIAAIILLLDPFKNQIIPYFPSLDNYLVYIFESLNNIYIIIKDLLNNYKY